MGFFRLVPVPRRECPRKPGVQCCICGKKCCICRKDLSAGTGTPSIPKAWFFQMSGQCCSQKRLEASMFRSCRRSAMLTQRLANSWSPLLPLKNRKARISWTSSPKLCGLKCSGPSCQSLTVVALVARQLHYPVYSPFLRIVRRT